MDLRKMAKNMDARNRSSKDFMVKVTQQNSVLDSDLKRENVRIDKMLSFVRKESKQIEMTRQLIANEINGRKSRQNGHNVALLQRNKNFPKTASVNALSQSKKDLNSALLRVKAFKLDEENETEFLPQIANQTGKLVSTEDSRTAPCYNDLHPNEKVRQYIQHLDSSMNKKNCERYNDIRPAIVDDSFNPNFQSVDGKRNSVSGKALLQGESPVYSKVSDGYQTKQISKVMNRRHSVMGITLNVPYIFDKPAENMHINPETDQMNGHDNKNSRTSHVRRLSDSFNCFGSEIGESSLNEPNSGITPDWNSRLKEKRVSTPRYQSRQRRPRRCSMPAIDCRTTSNLNLSRNKSSARVLEESSSSSEPEIF